MRFSIVIPTWEQHGRGVFFLTQLLNSIKAQTCTDFEVVISDHSENEEIKDLCSNFKELNIVYLKNTLNRGNSPANLNNGLRHARGEIIKIMFQDDFFIQKYTLEAIDKCFEIFSRKWLVTGSCDTPDSVIFSPGIIPKWNDRILEGINTIGSPSTLSFLNEDIMYFDENLVMLMDCDYYYAMYKKYGSPCVIEDCLVANTSHTHQISKMYNKDLQSEIKLMKNKVLNVTD